MKVSSSMISTSVAISAASFAAGLLHQFAQLRHVDIQHLGGVVLRKPFQRDQQKRLARHRRDLGQMTLDRLAGIGVPPGLPFTATEFQILVKRRYRPIRVEDPVSSTLGSWIRASRVAAT